MAGVMKLEFGITTWEFEVELELHWDCVEFLINVSENIGGTTLGKDCNGIEGTCGTKNQKRK